MKTEWYTAISNQAISCWYSLITTLTLSKFVDFGIAKLLTPTEGETDNLTRTGEVFGSPPYMSPEQCRALKVDARSDIYSLGCVMYRTVSGKQPITGHDLIEYLYKHVNETPAAFNIVCPELNIPARS
jgi:serine/threonine protein kinase